MNQRHGLASVLADNSFLGKTIAIAVALLAGVTLFLCAGTKEAQAQLLDADVTVEPTTVDFGDVELGEDAVEVVRITNNELTPIVIDPVGLEEEGIIDILDSEGNSLLSDLDGLLIGPGSFEDLQFVFSPDAEGPLTETLELEVFLNDLLGELLGTINIDVLGTAVLPPDDGEDPSVNIVRPKDKTKDRTPKVQAFVNDNTPLTKENIDLFIDNNQISDADYSYNPATGELVYNSTKLSRGEHTVRIVATDATDRSTTAAKAFKIKKKKKKR